MTLRIDIAGQEAAHLLDMLPSGAGHVLEIGCGDGRLTRKYRDHVKSVVGIELPDALDPVGFDDMPQAQRLAASVIELPLRNGCFDGAIFAHSF